MKFFSRRSKAPPASAYLAPLSSSELDLGYEAALPYLSPLPVELEEPSQPQATQLVAPELLQLAQAPSP